VADPKQLPHLLKLLDDGSGAVRDAVMQALASFGSALPAELARLDHPPDDRQRRGIQHLLEEHNRRWLRQEWRKIVSPPEDASRLETACALIAQFQYGKEYPASLKMLLDRLAEEYDSTHTARDPFQLASFLFKVKQLRGARKDYYNPHNGNLVYVIEERRGIPISLVCIYQLVGERLGLTIEGCNFPGHFLARVPSGKRRILVDCFNEGRVLDQETLLQSRPQATPMLRQAIEARVSSRTTICRILRNLAHAYAQLENLENSRLMEELLARTEERPEA
jgi:regulator of sirC expression with transglutaminase-like and TPR domain